MADNIPALSVADLQFEAGDKLLLDIENLNITSAGPTMILGPNGAGKSLFLRILHGLIPPLSGSVLFAGQPLDAAMLKRQAMVFQTPVLLRRSVAANVDYALKVHGIARADRPARLRALLDKAHLRDVARQPARTLSGGEQQRLALVRALANNPETLFLDEPTSSLDPGAGWEIEGLIADVARAGTKVIMVTHDLAAAQRIGEDIIFMHNGTVLEITPAKQFFAAPQSEKGRAFLASKLVL